MGLRVALLIGIAVLAAGCADLCGNDVVSEVSSPSGRKRAIVFIRDCGATTRFSIQVTVLPSNKKLKNQPGNAFIADDGHGDVPLRVDAVWDSDGELRLSYDPRLRTFRKEPAIGDVKVTFTTSP